MFEVNPVAAYEDQVIAEFQHLSLKCADGFDAMLGILAENEPNQLDRCGLLDYRHEVFAIPLPDCPKRHLIISIDCKTTSRPRIVHGTVSADGQSCEKGRFIAMEQLGIDGPWEPQQ